MNKKEMIDAVKCAYPKDISQLTRLEVETVLECAWDVMTAELLGGGEITLGKMGKLKVKEIGPRKARNPRTGESMDIPACRKVVFTPFGEFRGALKG